jgi:hypothetical protein
MLRIRYATAASEMRVTELSQTFGKKIYADHDAQA